MTGLVTLQFSRTDEVPKTLSKLEKDRKKKPHQILNSYELRTL